MFKARHTDWRHTERFQHRPISASTNDQAADGGDHANAPVLELQLPVAAELLLILGGCMRMCGGLQVRDQEMRAGWQGGGWQLLV